MVVDIWREYDVSYTLQLLGDPVHFEFIHNLCTWYNWIGAFYQCQKVHLISGKVIP